MLAGVKMIIMNRNLNHGSIGLSLSTAGVITALLLVTVPLLHSAPRTFTNTAGKEVVAEMVGATESTVTLKMSNGNKITANVTMFSKDDQTFITDWRQKHPSKIEYRFDIAFSK